MTVCLLVVVFHVNSFADELTLDQVGHLLGSFTGPLFLSLVRTSNSSSDLTFVLLLQQTKGPSVGLVSPHPCAGQGRATKGIEH